MGFLIFDGYIDWNLLWRVERSAVKRTTEVNLMICGHTAWRATACTVMTGPPADAF